ncbi:hypothetical protein QYE76_060865 [Lolium multiflorum]|uniref:Uncharacterized protein n=1 Tax=Lolium multiflorum TaxID=4521 RepID=A0AAD8S0V4_LOLMU|nr:hypothetical protein QYE76_060865 [Lolium multiflorum]
MVKKKNPAAAASSTSGGAAAKSSSSLPKGSAPRAPPPAPAPPAPSSSMVKPKDWVASTVTKRDEKRSRSLGLISSDVGDVILPGPKDVTRINAADLSEKELLDEVRRLTSFNQEDSIPLISSHTPLDADHPPSKIPIVSGNMHDSPDDTSEGRGSSIPVDFHTVDHTGLEDEYNGPIDFEVAHTDLPSSADDAGIADGSMRNDDADHDTFVDAAAEEARASPVKRSTGSFADEDDLFDIDEGFIEPPSKKARSDAASPVVVASEASAPKAAPMAQASTASSLSKGKDVSPTAATATPPSDMRGVISSLDAFASQFTSLEADKARLQEEVKSSTLKLDGAVKIAAEARQEVDSLKVELGKLKEKLKEEEASRLMAEAWSAEKDEVLQAANIPVDALDRVPNNSPVNVVAMILASHQLTRELLVKGKGALARMHSMIFPKIKQEKTLGQLVDTFAVDTKEVFPVPSFVDDSSGALPESDRIQRMKDRITQMEKDLRSTYALAAIVNKKSEIAADVERYTLAELHKATESLNFPLTLLTLMSEFGNAKKVRDLVRAQVFAGAKCTLSLVLARYPSACLLSIADATGDFEELYPKVLVPANIIVDRLEEESNAPEERETPQG